MICGARPIASAFNYPMKKLIRLGVIVCLLVTLTACSKKTESTQELTPPAAGSDAAPATTPQQPDPVVTAAVQSLPQVSKAIQGGQYENAVQTLVQMKPATAQMTDMQKLQYQQAVRDATSALINAMGSDPAAKAAYEKLSRSATGR